MLTPVQQSQYSTPIFITSKKEGAVRSITDYCSLNQNFFRNPYPLPIICETIQYLEGFKYATVLYINTEHYTIRLLPASQYMTTIINEFGKFRYNILPMGMCASGDIFQAKVDELLDDIEGVKTYIDDIPVLRKNCFTKHIEQLMIILCRLRALGLKFNAPKCSFGLNDIP